MQGRPENLEALLAYLGRSACLGTTFHPCDKLHGHCGESKRNFICYIITQMDFCLITKWKNLQLDTLEKRQRDHPAQVKLKSKVVRMLFLIVILFTLCWCPFSAFIITRNSLDSNELVAFY